jgi:hypothetical protein
LASADRPEHLDQDADRDREKEGGNLGMGGPDDPAETREPDAETGVLFMDILADAESIAENYAGLCGFVPAEHFYPPGRYCQWGRQYRAR